MGWPKQVMSPFLEGNLAGARRVLWGRPRASGPAPGLVSHVRADGAESAVDVIQGLSLFGATGAHGVRIKDGKASYATVSGRAGLPARERSGRASGAAAGCADFYNPTGPPGTHRDTALVWHDGRLMTLWRQATALVNLPAWKPGHYDYNGKLMHAFSPPEFDEKTGECLFSGYNMMGFDMAKGG